MHATLLTLLLAVPAQAPGTTTEQLTPAVTTQCGQGGCMPAGGQCVGQDDRNRLSRWLGSMPQTCYAPHFGSYPGNNRHMHRYPAMHGSYYRRPYNYRHSFDYPWHAAPHEPRGYSTLPCQQTVGDVIFTPQDQPSTAAESFQPIPSSPPVMPDPTY